MALSHFQVFNNWIFDGNLKTPIPTPKYDEDGKEVVPDILKYNSPITHTYVLKLFLRNGSLNYYLDTYMNNINLRYLDKAELLYFIKKAVIDYKIQKRDLVFYQYRQKDKLFEKLKYKFPMLKANDLDLLCDNIMKSEEKQIIMESLGLEKQEKIKKLSKKEIKKLDKNKSKNKTKIKDFIKENFSMIDV